MKALVLEEYNKLVYKDFPDPAMADDEVLIKVEVGRDLWFRCAWDGW